LENSGPFNHISISLLDSLFHSISIINSAFRGESCFFVGGRICKTATIDIAMNTIRRLNKKSTNDILKVGL